MKKFRNATWLMILALAASLASCNSSDDIYKYVPADVDFVLKADVTKLLAAADISIESDELKLPKEISSALNRDQKKNLSALLLQGNKAVDLTQVGMFAYIDTKRPQAYMVMPLKDGKALEQLLTVTIEEELDGEAFDKDEDEGYITYTQGRNDDGGIYVKDDMVYVVFDSKDPIGDLEDIAQSVKDKSFDSLDKVIAKADKDAAMVYYVNSSSIISAASRADVSFTIFGAAIQNELEGYWGVTNIAIKDKSLLCNSVCVNDQGKLYELPYGQPISRKALRHMPDSFIGAIAAGISKSDIQKLNDLYGQYAGELHGSDRYVTDMLMKYVRNIDGTLALGLGATSTSGLLSGDGLQFVVAVQLKKGNAQQAVAELKTLAQQQVEEQNNSFYSYYYGDSLRSSIEDVEGGFCYNMRTGGYYNASVMPIYVRAVDGDLVISNVKTPTNGGESLAKMISADDVVAMVVNIPTLAVYSNGKLNFGLQASALASKNKGSFKLEATDYKGSLVALIKDVIFAVQTYNPYASEGYYAEPDSDWAVEEEVAVAPDTVAIDWD